ncbi:hypothetical protein F383_20718 [Gossypium arboreum]|uniref:Uncharacterized protein n=1 Tax=Gossypium arboreum TaxID=29729 RepID=A0A0B0NSN6_GOSAR|nr:hypothetical protein F383_20718 [Gossypium arboreum]
MYYQSSKASPLLDLINSIFVFQLVCLFFIRLMTCLGSSTNTSCLSILRFDYVIPLSIS